jgi:hypothetical protein
MARISRLVIWPSCSNSASASRGAREHARARRSLDLDRDGVERADVAEVEAAAVVARCVRADRPALRARSCASAEADSASSRRERGRPSPSDVSASTRAPGCRCGGRDRARGHGARAGRLRQRPAEARGGQTEGRWRRHRHGFARVDMPQQDRTDAVNERVARGEHADLPAAMRQHLLDRALERAGPRPRRAADERRGEAEMRLPPNTISAP